MRKEIRFVSAEEAVKVVKSGDHVHLSSVASAPGILIEALCKRGEAGELQDVRIHHLHTEGPAPYTDPKFDGIFFHQVTYFLAQKNRDVFMYSGSFGNPILFLNNALTGTFGVWCFAIFLKQNRFLEFLGNNSLIILFFHFPVMRIAGMFFSQVLRMNVTTVATQIMIFFLTITLCLILSPLINRYFPILAGKVKTLEPEIPQ